MKVFIYLLCIVSAEALAGDINQIDYPIDFSGVLIQQPKMSKVKAESPIVNKYIQDNYTHINQPFCGGSYYLSPDQELKLSYERGMVNIVSQFGYTNNVQIYTPIRQLVQNPKKESVFKGYYFVSSKR